MNAAARALTQGITIASSPANIRVLALSRQSASTLALIVAIILTALSLITLSDNNREMMGQLQTLQQNRNVLQTQYSQLLLEKNTWIAPARIEHLAKQEDGLVFPTAQKVVIIHS